MDGVVEGKTTASSPLPGETQTPDKAMGTQVVFFHAGSSLLVKELIHCNNICAVVDLTPGPGLWALACLTLRLPYAGICMNKLHMDGLTAHLVDRVLSLFTTPNNPLHNAAAAEFMAELTTDTECNQSNDDGVPEPKALAKSKAKAAAKGRAKGKAKAAAEAGGEPDPKKARAAEILDDIKKLTTPKADGLEAEGEDEATEAETEAEESDAGGQRNSDTRTWS